MQFKQRFPHICLLCDGLSGRAQDLCQPCSDDLPWLKTACPRCAHPMETTALCGACQKTTPSFDRSVAAFRYERPIDKLITQLKFNQQLLNARILGENMAERMTHHPLPQRLIPVPLHKTRLRERGFNQSLEIARHIGQCLSIPVSTHPIKRSKQTRPQSSLGEKERKKNIRGAFTLTRPIEHQHVAIIDDVMTTGGTVNELAKILKKNAVSLVEVWVVARA